MNSKQILYDFEDKYKDIYSISVRGVPIYTCHRDTVLCILTGEADTPKSNGKTEKGRIYLRRVLDGIIKFRTFRKHKTLIFTSSMYRRDKGRNLAAEFLMDRYPDAVVFEWPSRVEIYDRAYFMDKQMNRYCPLDCYLFLFKLHMKVHRKRYTQLVLQCAEYMKSIFGKWEKDIPQNEKRVIQYLMDTMPKSYATTVMSQQVFWKLFKNYRNVKYAIDFWGSARENIIPVLQNSPQSIELQHGIITSEHPGYIYPDFVRQYAPHFFGRKLLIYGKATEKLLIKHSIFEKNQIEVIGNPRIIEYKKAFSPTVQERKLLLFTSQPFEQDGKGTDYYATVIPILKEISRYIESKPEWKGFQLAIKLHPRENNGVGEVYLSELPKCIVYDNSAQLYDLLLQTSLHITANSTTLYEAAVFGAPTIAVMYSTFNPEVIFGRGVKVIKKPSDVSDCLSWLSRKYNYETYLCYMKQLTSEFM